MMKERKMQSAKCKEIRHRSADARRFLCFSFCLFTFYFLLSAAPVSAQDDQPPKDAAPPPMRIIPKDERKLLNDERDIKKRTQLALNLMETHLLKAEELGSQNKFQDSLFELGNYNAIRKNALDFLNSRDDHGNKVDNNFKRLEIGLRKTVPRLEILRREMPFNYGYYVRELQKFVRDTRAKALEPLFDDTVVPERKT
ncbi:MAG: hypothetical protein ACR2LT_02380 [Pyrinomonadaceae bacterium]